MATQAVAAGDRCFVDEDYARAVEHYTEVCGLAAAQCLSLLAWHCTLCSHIFARAPLQKKEARPTQQALKIAPSSSIYEARSNAYAKLGSYVEAAQDGGKAVELDPQNAKAHLRKGCAVFFDAVL